MTLRQADAASAEEQAEETIGLHSLQPAPGSRKDRKRVGRGHGSGHGKTVRPRPQGLRLARRRQGPRPLRGRPEPDPHADAQAARPEQEDVDAVRAVPDAHAAREPRRPRGALRRGRRGRPRRAAARRAWRRAGTSRVKILGRGELTKALTVHAHGVLQVRARAHRGRGRHLPGHRRLAAAPCRMLATILNAFKVADIRKKLAFTAAHARALPARRLHPGPGRRHRGGQGDRGELRRLEHPRPPEPVHRRRAVADRDLRAGDHALHHGVDHPAAADGGLAVAGEAAEGGRGRPGADHAVHALPDRRPGRRAGRRLRLPLPLAGQRARAPR